MTKLKVRDAAYQNNDSNEPQNTSIQSEADFKVPARFSYPAKDITLAATTEIGRRRFPKTFRNTIMKQASALVGIVPFDWERRGNIFNMYFGLDTVELAVAAKQRLEEFDFTVLFFRC
jgi:hypothetical protein